MDLVINHTKIIVASGELAFEEADALIHPTNTYLWFSAGFSDALRQQGGESLEQEAIAAGPIPIGTAVTSAPGRLRCRMVIHAAAWAQDMMTDPRKIHDAVTAALTLASRNQCRTVAIPPVGADVGRFPLPRAIEATFLTIVEHCLQETAVREIHFLAADRSVERALNSLIQSALSAQPPDEEEENKEMPS